MCGRYTLSEPGDLFQELGVEPPEDFQPRYNVAPTQTLPAVRATAGGDGRELVELRWGLVPFWADEPSIGNRMINARSETAAKKPAFRQAFRKRRCLLPADGFYEWAKEGGQKQPYHIFLEGHRPFTFAGLWEHWARGEDVIESFTILTTDPAPDIEHLHDRMPVILPPDVRDLWLDPGVEDAEALRQLLRPYPGNDLAFVPVSRVVNSPKNDRPECVQPLQR